MESEHSSLERLGARAGLAAPLHLPRAKARSASTGNRPSASPRQGATGTADHSRSLGLARAGAALRVEPHVRRIFPRP